MIETLTYQLRSIRLSAMAEQLNIRIQEARANELPYEVFLQNLLEDELAKRRDRLMQRRLKAAGFPQFHTLEDFDYAFNPSLSKRQVKELASSAFISRHDNVLLLGPPGVGKTHLSVALGIEAISKGFSVYYRSIFDAAFDLYQDEDQKALKKYLTPNLLILDELGMKTLPPRAAESILEIIHRRHYLQSTLIATNRPIEDWGKILGDNAATSAILDRFLEQVHILKITGRSYRLKNLEEAKNIEKTLEAKAKS